MTVAPDPKTELHHYFRQGREALLWKLDGVGEYDARRPLTPTGTNLLGLVKHTAIVIAGYFGEVFDRPFPEPLPRAEETAAPKPDMWALPGETRSQIVALFHAANAHADATIDALDLDSPGHVPWWSRPVTLSRILVHVVAEVHRHAGHADIVRETVDGAAGLRADNTNLADGDAGWWAEYRGRVQAEAERFR
jgi:hypothetical protein